MFLYCWTTYKMLHDQIFFCFCFFNYCQWIPLWLRSFNNAYYVKNFLFVSFVHPVSQGKSVFPMSFNIFEKIIKGLKLLWLVIVYSVPQAKSFQNHWKLESINHLTQKISERQFCYNWGRDHWPWNFKVSDSVISYYSGNFHDDHNLTVSWKKSFYTFIFCIT